MHSTQIIVGLGNPGLQYARTRHNAGFLFLDQLAKDWNLAWQNNKTHQYLWAQLGGFEQKLVLVKPQAFMNQSGKVAKAVLAKFLLKPQDLWVAHDDLDIPMGEVKLQFAKGPHIHNGLLSIYEVLGTQDFWHLRIGIDSRQGSRTMPGSQYVLKPLEKAEEILLKEGLQTAALEFKSKLSLG